MRHSSGNHLAELAATVNGDNGDCAAAGVSERELTAHLRPALLISNGCEKAAVLALTLPVDKAVRGQVLGSPIERGAAAAESRGCTAVLNGQHWQRGRVKGVT